MRELEYDLVALGGGTAGLVSAAGSAYLGARSAILEREALGGDCLWTGCVPSKALIASARAAHAMRHAGELGLVGASPGHVFREVMERMRSARATVAHHDDPKRFRAMGVDVHLGVARFLSPGLLEVDGVGRIRSKRIVIATGAHAWIPPIPGLQEAGYLTHATAFDQDTLPESVVILGGGPIGLEFAQIYARLGARITVLEMLPEILSREDPDIAATLRNLLEREGIRVVTREKAVRVEREDGVKVVVGESGRRFEGQEILVAVGREPNTGELGLEHAGVERDGLAVRVNATLATTAKGVWAAGDVTGGLQFTHVADAMARIAVQNALLPMKKSVDWSTVPWVTFTDPEVAHMGASQAEAEARGASTFTYEFADLDRAIVDGDTAGYVKISADRRGRILGATIVGGHAGELIFPLVMAKRHGIPLSRISETIFPYPTRMEAVKRASDIYQRGRLEGLGGRVLKKVVSWLT